MSFVSLLLLVTPEPKRIYGGFRVVGLVLPRSSVAVGEPHEGSKLLRFLAEIKRALVVVPERVRAAKRARPFKLEIAQEAGFDFPTGIRFPPRAR